MYLGRLNWAELLIIPIEQYPIVKYLSYTAGMRSVPGPGVEKDC